MSIKIFEDQIRIKMYLETLEKEMNSCVSILNNLIETRGFKISLTKDMARQILLRELRVTEVIDYCSRDIDFISEVSRLSIIYSAYYHTMKSLIDNYVSTIKDELNKYLLNDK